MKCLHPTCPMRGKHCPAIKECPEAKKRVIIPLPEGGRCVSSFGGKLELTPKGLIELHKALLPYLEHADCNETWPKHVV